MCFFDPSFHFFFTQAAVVSIQSTYICRKKYGTGHVTLATSLPGSWFCTFSLGRVNIFKLIWWSGHFIMPYHNVAKLKLLNYFNWSSWFQNVILTGQEKYIKAKQWHNLPQVTAHPLFSIIDCSVGSVVLQLPQFSVIFWKLFSFWELGAWNPR